MRLGASVPGSRIATVVALALAGAAAVAACGLGEESGAAGGEAATLVVTSDFGTEPMVEATVEAPSPSDTVIRFLDREAEVETEYGGNFVSSINGLSGGESGGLRQDWFFYVNGYWSPVGAAEAPVRPGDRIWWDHREWSGAYRVPAVVGSWPEPFAHGRDGERPETVLECIGGGEACEVTEDALRDAGADLAGEAGTDALRVVVGPIDELERQPVAERLRKGPESSGVYARLVDCRPDGTGLELLGREGESLGSVAEFALVAASARGDEQPTWIVSGTDPEWTDRAAAMLGEEELGSRYAVIAGPEGPVSLPADELPEGVERCPA